MKRKYIVLFVAAVILFLIRKPEYWKTFKEDENRYRTDTFYYVIKEEYKENKDGEREYQPEFTNIRDGDILVTDSTYCFCFRHGHAALVVDAENGITLEAFGIGTESELSKIDEWLRYPHVKVLRLNAPEEICRNIAAYAEKNMRGIPYMLSPGVIDDKDMDGTYWGTQCAHLIWAAFQKYGYDIDGDGGWLVTPEDFTFSKNLRVVPQE